MHNQYFGVANLSPVNIAKDGRCRLLQTPGHQHTGRKLTNNGNRVWRGPQPQSHRSLNTL